jgi:hypothetical protein
MIYKILLRSLNIEQHELHIKRDERMCSGEVGVRVSLRVMVFSATFYNISNRIGGVMVNVLPVQSVPITTNTLSSNTVHGEVYSIQHYVIKFVSDLRQLGDFRQVLRFPPTIKLTANNLQSKLSNLQSKPNNLQSKPNNLQSKPNNQQSKPKKPAEQAKQPIINIIFQVKNYYQFQ